jgi:pimeloyl-ACP methyl ester carboxylesterase
MSQLGLYDPAAFIEAAPTMFYALEEDLAHKVPVIFVHGIGGSPAEFRSLIERMDRTRYKPWLYFYPSGGDLAQLARLFRDIFLSGSVIALGDTPIVIVAHSMGGLLVREALNQCEHGSCGNRVTLLITVATPFGGMPSAHAGVARAPLVPPAWRALDPSGSFIQALFRHPLPEATTHHLIYTYRRSADSTQGTDGVVPLSSQLASGARTKAAMLHGFKSGHTEVLHNPAAITCILELVHNVRSGIPEEQIRFFEQGGFDVPLSAEYSEMERYAISNLGYILRALANGEVRPAYPVQRQFVDAVQGDTAATTPLETGWARFRLEYPELATASGEP